MVAEWHRRNLLHFKTVVGLARESLLTEGIRQLLNRLSNIRCLEVESKIVIALKVNVLKCGLIGHVEVHESRVNRNDRLGGSMILGFHHVHAVSIEQCAIGLSGRVVQATIKRLDSEFHIVCFRIVKLQCFYLLAKVCDCASPITQIGLKRLYTGKEEVGALAEVDSHVNGFDQV